MTIESRPLTPADLASRWGVKENSLSNRRLRGQPPAFLRVGTRRRIAYPLAGVEALEREGKVPRPRKRIPRAPEP